MKESFATVLETIADARPNSLCVSFEGHDTTWSQLDDEASRIAAALDAGGIGQSSRVAVALYNGPQYLAVLWAVLKVRAVPVNINYRYRAEEMAALFDDGHVEAVVYDAALDRQIAGALELAKDPVKLTIVVGGDAGDQLTEPGPRGEQRTAYEQIVSSVEPMPRQERGDDDWMLYTGGTTGRPRGVLVRHSWLFSTVCANSYLVMGVTAPDTLQELRDYLAGIPADRYDIVTVPAAPLMHGTGIYTSLGALVAGGRVAYLAGRSYDADEFAQLIQDQQADTVSIVGEVFARPLADALDKAAEAGHPYDLSHLKRIISVGVMWSADTKARLLQHGDFVCRDTIASSEGGPFAVAETRRGDDTTTARFKLAPRARVIDADGTDVMPGSGQVGVLAAPADDYIHYQGDPAKTAETFRVIDGTRWVVPGDMASIEADGTMTFHGRGSQVINTGGEKVFAEEVENAVITHPAVRDVMVVGVPDPKWGARVAAVVTVKPGNTITLDELREHVGQELAGYKRPTLLVVQDELKRSPSGKADVKWAKQTAIDAASES